MNDIYVTLRSETIFAAGLSSIIKAKSHKTGKSFASDRLNNTTTSHTSSMILVLRLLKFSSCTVELSLYTVQACQGYTNCPDCQNGRPRLPDPQVLELLHHTETKLPKSSDTKVKTESEQAKEPGDGPKATQLGRYGSVNEVLMASLVEWLEGGQQVEEGIWPDHKHDMAKLSYHLFPNVRQNSHASDIGLQTSPDTLRTLSGNLQTSFDSLWKLGARTRLYEDLSMWHSELKKVVAGIVPSMYNLIPPSHVLPEQRATWIEEAAKKLLEDAIFLCYGVDQNRKINNAAHPDLTVLLAGDWMSSGMSYHLNAWHWFCYAWDESSHPSPNKRSAKQRDGHGSSLRWEVKVSG
ncbi:uncharacterized protein F5891DRAFT_981527 [Suillus fuscotomentosus]|uniref:Uncharacterized protein n=1 Tax=Suillus fuscotomentosus TaxID=1912939 RepID=A0AAD4HJW4_9AGAM|nr:uncharacterized protein F5891DRAFT_981527 [Suillus fuscotomentosus]KAG1898871.1 hypothetical protein F5891DRAFT_981527 [Suillus fuscotomentosus]